jgi:nucleoside-diphosphate-sugar epimerase
MLPEDLYAGKCVLVTGASGFVGRHLVERLARLQARVVASSRSFDERHPPGGDQGSITHTRLDVTDSKAVETLVKDVRPDVIFHLAALISSDRGPASLIPESNVTLGGTINVAATSIQQRVPFLVHLGSSEEYGGGPVPFEEEQQEQPLSPYSAAKSAASLYLKMCRRAYSLSFAIARPTVIYGPHQRKDSLISHLFENYMSGRPACLTHGEQSRDFIYIDDVVEALCLLGTRADLAGQVVNVGSGSEYRVKDVAVLVAELCRYQGKLGLGSRPARHPEVMRHMANIDKARKLLGWQPRVGLPEGLARTLAWARQPA